MYLLDKKMRNSGQVLIVAIVLMLLITALSFAMFQTRFLEWQSFKKQKEQITALYIADAGLEQALYLLRRIGTPVWEYGNPVDTWVPTNGVDDGNMFGTVINGKYPVDLTTSGLLVTLVSPPISLPSSGTPNLTFQHWYETEATQDGGWLVISNDDGKSWTRITTLTPAYTSYYAGIAGNSCYGGRARDAGLTPIWEGVTVNLSSYLNQTIRIGFRFFSNASITYAGWYIDDVSVSTGADPCNPCFTDNFENGPGNWSHEILINNDDGFQEEFPSGSQNIYHIVFDPRFRESDTWYIRSTGSTGDYSRTVEAKVTVHGSSSPYQVKVHHYKEVM